jgi:predicted Zn-dependent protease
VKGLKKLRDGPPTQLRHGISPQQLRKGMDIVFPPGPSAENATSTAASRIGHREA